MYKEIFTGLSLLLAAIAFSHARADIYKEIIPIEKIKKPIHLCKKSPAPKLTKESVVILKQTVSDVQCGNYDEALEKLYYAVELVTELQGRAVRGYCYSRRNCNNPKVSAQLVTKAQCKATGIADSWKPMTPTPGACVSPL